MLLNKIIQHLITREGIFVVAWSPVQVGQGCCHFSKAVYSSLALWEWFASLWDVERLGRCCRRIMLGVCNLCARDTHV